VLKRLVQLGTGTKWARVGACPQRRLVPPKVRVLIDFLLEHFDGDRVWDRMVAQAAGWRSA